MLCTQETIFGGFWLRFGLLAPLEVNGHSRAIHFLGIAVQYLMHTGIDRGVRDGAS